MKKILAYLSVFFIGGLIISGCSKVREDLPTETTASIVHGEGFLKVGHPNFHGTYIRQHNWDMTLCQQCHGNDYSGGKTNVSCKKCHTSASGPEACNTCHGNFNEPGVIAPPKDTKGNTDVTARGVGAHQKHVYNNTFSVNLSCSECHVTPRGFKDPVHINDTVATVTFGTFTQAHSASASYDPATVKCANTYCHGNFSFNKADAAAQDQYIFTGTAIAGDSYAPQWTNPNDGKCGTCHGLPPKGHIGEGGGLPITSCGGSGCHQGVVDANGNIIDQTRHINGGVNVHGN